MLPPASAVICPPPQLISPQSGHFYVDASLRAAIASYHLGREQPISWRLDSSLKAEEYRLQVQSTGIHVCSASESGYFYALQSLKQLLRQYPEQLPCLSIHDWPVFANRGMLYDISRDRVPCLDKLKQLIDLWAELKYNQLQLYMEAAFAYQDHAQAWQGRDPLSAADIQMLDQYCAERGIELIANQNCFGHLENWLDLPHYQHLAEQVGGCTDPAGNWRNHSFSLNPISQESVDFVQSLLGELLPNFRSQQVNINADETFDLGQGASKAICDQLGKGQVYWQFLQKIIQPLQQQGHRVQLWADILLHYPELLPELPKDLCVLNWGYEAKHPFEQECAALAQAGLTFYVVSATSTFASLTGRWQNCRANLINASQAAVKYGACGFYMSEWGDFGHAQPYIAALPGYVLGACAAWQPQNLEQQDCALLIEKLWLPDAQLCAVLFGLADLYLLTQTADQLPGVGIFGALLFNQMTNRHMKKVQTWSATGFAAALGLADHYVGMLRTKESSDAQQELLYCALFARHACRLGLYLAKQQDYRVSLLPLEQRMQLDQELTGLMPLYKKEWLRHSQAGGLDASFDRLQFLSKLYRGEVKSRF